MNVRNSLNDGIKGDKLARSTSFILSSPSWSRQYAENLQASVKFQNPELILLNSPDAQTPTIVGPV